MCGCVLGVFMFVGVGNTEDLFFVYARCWQKKSVWQTKASNEFEDDFR